MRSHARTLVRTLLPAGAAAVLLVLSGGLVTPAAAVDDTTSCQGVLSGADSDLQKSLVSITPGANAGDYTIEYSLQSSRPAGVYRLRDCAFIDTGAPGYTGEPLVGATDEKDTSFVSSTGGGSTATFTETVTGVQPNDRLCDRAAMSGTDAGTSFTDKSNVLCITPNNPPVVAESHLAVTLPLAAAGAVAIVLLVQRRRSRATVTAPAD
jgi:hypothetical protein